VYATLCLSRKLQRTPHPYLVRDKSPSFKGDQPQHLLVHLLVECKTAELETRILKFMKIRSLCSGILKTHRHFWGRCSHMPVEGKGSGGEHAPTTRDSHSCSLQARMLNRSSSPGGKVPCLPQRSIDSVQCSDKPLCKDWTKGCTNHGSATHLPCDPFAGSDKLLELHDVLTPG